MPAFNTPLTLSVLRSLVRNMVLERSGDTGLVTDPELNDLINLAARTLWLRIANKYPDIFSQRSGASITVASGAGVAFSAIVTGGGVGGNVYRILNAYVGSQGAAENAMELIHEFDKVQDRHVYEPGVGGTPTGLVAQPTLPFRWYVEGITVFFTPQTTGSFDARFQWVQQPQDMTADGDTCWGGLNPTYHDAVAMFAAALVFAKDSNILTPMDSAFRYVDQVLQEQFGPPANPYADEPRARRP